MFEHGHLVSQLLDQTLHDCDFPTAMREEFAQHVGVELAEVWLGVRHGRHLAWNRACGPSADAAIASEQVDDSSLANALPG